MILLIMVSCDNGTSTKKQVKSKYITVDSAPYELLVVCDKDWLQTTDGSIVMDVVNSEVPGLPQIESNFKVLSINPRGFNKIYQSFANIIVLDFNSKYKKAEMKIAHDTYAHPQIIVYITAPTGKALAEFVSIRSQQLIDLFVNAELNRKRDYLKHHSSGKVMTYVQKHFGCNIYVPKDINAIKEGKNFMWASSNQTDNRMNICIYSFPFTAEENFSKESFIAHRDSFMKKNIQGNNVDQYMTTTSDYISTRKIMFEGHFVLEARGLWNMHNDMMGGPFVSYTQVDTVSNLIIVAEGFVYAPDKNKKTYIRELEAAIQTLTINKKTEDQK